MDFDVLKNANSEGSKRLVEHTKKMRNEIAVPQTLLVLTIKAVINNYKSFIDCSLDKESDDTREVTRFNNNPFINIPNTILQRFFKIISESTESGEELLPKNVEKHFVLHLLNPNVTEFKCEWNDHSFIYLKHMMENCPKITEQTLELNETDFLVLCHEETTWRNLKNLTLCGVDDETLKRIQEKFPKLERMEVVTAEITMGGVSHLSKMLNLRYLSITDDEVPMEIIVEAAGNIPSLQKLKFPYGEGMSRFIELYSQRYAHKKLVLRQLCLTAENFHGDWPTALSVEALTLKGIFTDHQINQICLIPCSSVYFDPVLPSQIHKIVEKLGSGVLNLQIWHFYLDPEESYHTPNHMLQILQQETLQVCKVLKDCPKLETFYLCTPVKLAAYENCGVSLKSLKKCSFDYRQLDDATCKSIFKMFLVQSKNIDDQIEINHHQIQIMLEALREDADCLNKLKAITIKMETEDLDYVINLAAILILRSPSLGKIHFECKTKIDRQVISQHPYTWFHAFARDIGVTVEIEDRETMEENFQKRLKSLNTFSIDALDDVMKEILGI